jgi:hypothetical protein
MEKVGKPVWQHIIDKAMDMKFSAFHKNKDSSLDITSAQLKEMERIVDQEIQV